MEKARWEVRFQRVFNNICKKYSLSKTTIANASGIDPTYTTMFSKTGRIPTRKVMSMVDAGLDALEVDKKDVIAMWMSAGMLPSLPNEGIIKELVNMWPVATEEIPSGTEDEVEGEEEDSEEVEFTIA